MKNMTDQERDNLVTNLRNIRDVCHRQANGGYTTESDAYTALAQIEKLAEAVEALVHYVKPNRDRIALPGSGVTGT